MWGVNMENNFNFLPRFFRFGFLVLLVLNFLINPAYAGQPEDLVPQNEAKTHYMLGIIGYNYTNRTIDGFSIDGHGGGDIRVSSPTSGGGGTMCCVLLSKKPTWPIQVLVRWQSGGCRVYDKKRPSGRNYYAYKELKVNVEKGASAYPSDIGVHFYPDGSVRVRLSEGSGMPLLQLSESRLIDDYLPECKPGYPVEYL
jgi:hypothetical protein